jgi:hypothetical protein
MPVPLALVGALFVTWIAGGGLDIFGLMGMLMLIGLSAKNAILYLDFVVERIGKMPLKDALIDAAKLRFRPIVMTTLTVLVISIPLVFSTGQGSEFGKSMGVVMFGGIVFSAVLTFFLVPAAFFLFEGKRTIDMNAKKAEIDQACADIEGGLTPNEGTAAEECAAINEGTATVAEVSEESVSAQPGLADAPGRSRRKRKLPAPPEESEEYGV